MQGIVLVVLLWSANAGFEDDSNGDGISNGLAWVLGAESPSEGSSSILPTAQMSSDQAQVIFEYRRSDQAHSDTIIVVEYSNDLIGWIPALGGVDGVMITETDDHHGSGIDRVQVQVPTSLTQV